MRIEHDNTVGQQLFLLAWLCFSLYFEEKKLKNLN